MNEDGLSPLAEAVENTNDGAAYVCGVAGDEPNNTAQFSRDLAVYLGCGNVEGPGTVVQLDQTGKVLGTLQLPGTPYGLAVHKDGLVVAAGIGYRIWHGCSNAVGPVAPLDERGVSQCPV